MIQEPFSTGSSPIHRLDPRAKLVAAAAFSVVVSLSHRFPALISALAISLALVFLSHLNFRAVVRRLLVVAWFLLLLWALLPVTYEGETLFRVGRFVISRPGVDLAAQITLKTTAILLLFMSLVATMPVATLGHALNRLHLPQKLVHLLLLTYRYIFVIEAEYRKLVTAIRIRGFRSGTNMHSYKTYAYLIGMLFVRASVRAERVHQAMRCRGFKGKFYSLHDFEPSKSDLLFSALSIFALLSLIALEWNLYDHLR